MDAFDAGLRTDSSFGRARPLPDDGRIARWFRSCAEVPVVTGFIGKDEHDNVTTLGRNGSDYSAALFGNALDADEIQIWKEVDGVMTADPKLVPHARPIPAMSFAEASEIAYWGSRVLHPAAIQPAMAKAIPVRVLNSARGDAHGTSILASCGAASGPLRTIVHKRGVVLINLVSPRMLAQHGFLAQVFAAAARFEIDVDVVATSEVSISMTIDADARVVEFTAALAEIGDVTAERGLALVCAIGAGIAAERDVAARVLAALAAAEVPVRVISQGAIKVSIATIVAESDLARAVPALHDAFFPARARRAGAPA